MDIVSLGLAQHHTSRQHRADEAAARADLQALQPSGGGNGVHFSGKQALIAGALMFLSVGGWAVADHVKLKDRVTTVEAVQGNVVSQVRDHEARMRTLEGIRVEQHQQTELLRAIKAEQERARKERRK
jgi:hypothetical protein